MDQSKITKDRDIDNLTVTYKVIDYPILDSPPILEQLFMTHTTERDGLSRTSILFIKTIHWVSLN